MSATNAGRVELENITKALHEVSQTIDSGTANALMSIKLSTEMLNACNSFCILQSSAARQTRDSISYLLKSFNCQRDWLSTYKARKDTAMNLVRTIVPLSAIDIP